MPNCPRLARTIQHEIITVDKWEWEKGGGKNLQVIESFSGKGTR